MAQLRSGSLQAAISGDLKVAATRAIVPIFIFKNRDPEVFRGNPGAGLSFATYFSTKTLRQEFMPA